MGCRLSKREKLPELRQQSLVDFLTPEEVKMILETWEVVVQDKDDSGIYMFKRLFESHAELKPMFRRLMTKEESGEYVFDEKMFLSHSRSFMKTLTECVNAATEALVDPKPLSEHLSKLGKTHIDFDVTPNMFPFLWPALRDGIKYAMETQEAGRLTEECELAWKHFYDFISHKMIEGMQTGRGSN